MAITRVCLRAVEVTALVNRIVDDNGYIAEDQFWAGLQRLERMEVTDQTVFDGLDAQYQSGYWPPTGRWDTEQSPDGKDITSVPSDPYQNRQP